MQQRQKLVADVEKRAVLITAWPILDLVGVKCPYRTEITFRKLVGLRVGKRRGHPCVSKIKKEEIDFLSRAWRTIVR